MSQSMLALLALITGAMIPFQLALNGQLGTALKSVYLGAFFVFLVGLLALAVLVLALRIGWPSPADLAEVPATAWAGGLVATAYIVAVVFLVPRLGVGTTAVLVIAGQLVAAMALDHAGAFGAAANPVTLARLAGAAMVLAGAAVVKFA
ncbi:MAG: DMT family transporter [Silicimonas sp.]|jgi:transporter family-2 protein|nr:DMT family transporter [Silicimonas sp.]